MQDKYFVSTYELIFLAWIIIVIVLFLLQFSPYIEKLVEVGTELIGFQ